MGVNMCGDEKYVRISRVGTGKYIEIHESYVRIRETKNKLLAFNIKAPIFETEEIERFFEGFNASERLAVNIGGTGNFDVRYRGLIEGKDKNYSQNIDHKIILFQESFCPTKEDLKRFKRVSKFMPRRSLN